MSGSIIGFIIWGIVGLLLICIGIYDFFSKKAVGFWANVDVEHVKDVKRYNYAVGKLFIVYGIIFILLGIPILMEQNVLVMLVSVPGCMIETIAIMIIYTQVISKKYRA